MIQASPAGLTAADVLPYLKGVKKTPRGYIALCPCHNDHDPSLSLTEKNGKLLAHCGAKCNQYDVWSTLCRLAGKAGKRNSSLPNRAKEKTSRRYPRDSDCVATYPYYDEDGKLLYEKRRYERAIDGTREKTFLWWSKENGRWKTGRGNDARPILYRLLELIDLKPGDELHIAEGEKCVDHLDSLGFKATCHPDGGGKWKAEILERIVLDGVHVVIHEDNDKVGQADCPLIARDAMERGAKSVRVVRYPDLPSHGDVFNYLQSHTAEELKKKVVETPVWSPPPPAQEVNTRLRATQLQPLEFLNLDGATSPPDWVIEPWMAKNEIGLIAAEPGVGKTLCGMDLCQAIAQGRDWWGFTPRITGPALYVNEEMATDRVKATLQRLGGSHPDLHVLSLQGLRFDDTTARERLEVALDVIRPVVVVFDTLRMLLGCLDENDSGDTANVYRQLTQYQARFGGFIAVMLAHLRKPGERETWGPNCIRGSGVHQAMAGFLIGLRRDPLDDSCNEVHQWKRRGIPLDAYRMRCDEGDGQLDPIRLTKLGVIGSVASMKPKTAKKRLGDAAVSFLQTNGPGSRSVLDEALLKEGKGGKKRGKTTLTNALQDFRQLGKVLKEEGRNGRWHLPGQEDLL